MPIRKQPPSIGEVVYNECRSGTSIRATCPRCHKFVRTGYTHCAWCGTSFVSVTDGYVQVIEVREHVTPG